MTKLTLDFRNCKLSAQSLKDIGLGFENSLNITSLHLNLQQKYEFRQSLS
ncbi:hypothetical protein ABPG74_007853 [Tetrahymena malaccensis]